MSIAEKQPITRKSEKYENMPAALGVGEWGPEFREKHYDQLPYSIQARIQHISKRLDNYLPPNEEVYNVDQFLALDLETAFDELAQLFLERSKEGLGGYFIPENKDRNYDYAPIIAFDEKLEEIHDLIIKAEGPFFKEKEGKELLDPEAKIASAVWNELSNDEKTKLHEEGTTMLKEALEKINVLKQTVESRESLVV